MTTFVCHITEITRKWMELIRNMRWRQGWERGHWTGMERFIFAHNSTLGWARKGSSFSQAQPETLTTQVLRIQHMQQCWLDVVLNRDKVYPPLPSSGSTAPQPQRGAGHEQEMDIPDGTSSIEKANFQPHWQPKQAADTLQSLGNLDKREKSM